LAILIQKVYGYSAQWILYEEGSVLKKIIYRTLKSRPRLIAVMNTFTKEEIDMVLNHIDYIISETPANITDEFSDVTSVEKNKQ
jgi:hypothetical protein